MIDPINITNYKLTVPQLEEHILWWVCAAGKNGVVAAKSLSKFLWNAHSIFTYTRHAPALTSFEIVRLVLNRPYGIETLAHMMKGAGIGAYTQKSNTFRLLAMAEKLDLKTVSVEALMAFKGIGPKTARAFVVHSRPQQRYAILDTHLLKFLRHQGIMAPDKPPTPKKYLELEQAFLRIVDLGGLEVADLDLAIWNHYRETPEVKFDLEGYINDYHEFCTIGCSC